jgi:hypothetical protein
MNTCVKLLQSSDPPVPPFEIVFVRQIVTYSVSLYFLIRQRSALSWYVPDLGLFIHSDNLCISYWSTRSPDFVGVERDLWLFWYLVAFTHL